MTLSREVPEKISGSLRGFVIKLCERAQVDFSEVMKTGVFAVHPGGPKIIDAVQECLELRDEQIQASREVLSERGNMSSATLPHVWHKLLIQNIPPGKKVLSLAFGPGLTIFGAVFESL
jgi:predicted naringenin-chalcone synthase